MDINGAVDWAAGLWAKFNSLAGVAIIISLVLTQGVKGLIAWKERSVPASVVWMVSFLVTALAFLGVCAWCRMDIRATNTVWNAVIAGGAGPWIVWGLKRVLKVDIDDVLTSKLAGNGARRAARGYPEELINTMPEGAPRSHPIPTAASGRPGQQS